jgi:hypothetical protein
MPIIRFDTATGPVLQKSPGVRFARRRGTFGRLRFRWRSRAMIRPFYVSLGQQQPLAAGHEPSAWQIA